MEESWPYAYFGKGGTGGGGNAGRNQAGEYPTAGTDGLGGGGGAANGNTSITGMKGGSGIVIIRYLEAQFYDKEEGYSFLM